MATLQNIPAFATTYPNKVFDYMAAGKPTVITDLMHTGSVPALDPRNWTVLAGSEPPERRSERQSSDESDGSPICIAIDIVDEQHSLALAMRRLAENEDLRRELGKSAHEYWKRNHTPEQMAEDYEQAIQRALCRPAPDRSGLPSHLLYDGTGLTGGIIGELGLSLERLDWGTAADGRQ